MQEDILGSHYCYGCGDALDGRETQPRYVGYGRGDMHGSGDCDETGLGIVSGEIGDTGDGAGGADGYGVEGGSSEEV